MDRTNRRKWLEKPNFHNHRSTIYDKTVKNVLKGETSYITKLAAILGQQERYCRDNLKKIK
jgi:hypothetical protein